MGDSLIARVKMQCANRPFWPLVSKYTIFALLRLNVEKWKNVNIKK